MKRIKVRWVIVLVTLTIILTSLSCAHEKAGLRDAAARPAAHEGRVSEYLKGVEESQRIVVARVNGTDITLYALINRMNQIAPGYMPHGQQRTPEIDHSVKQEALDILIFRELAVQEAARQGMKVGPEEVGQIIEKLKENLGSENAYGDYLRTRGITEHALKMEMARNRIFDMIASKEIFQKVVAGANGDRSVDRRKEEWEAELKKNATIEITLDAVEKKMAEDAKKHKKE